MCISFNNLLIISYSNQTTKSDDEQFRKSLRGYKQSSQPRRGQ